MPVNKPNSKDKVYRNPKKRKFGEDQNVEENTENLEEEKQKLEEEKQKLEEEKQKLEEEKQKLEAKEQKLEEEKQNLEEEKIAVQIAISNETDDKKIEKLEKG